MPATPSPSTRLARSHRAFCGWWGGALLAVLVALVVGPALSGPFVFDDTTNLAGDPNLAAGRIAMFVAREPADLGSSLAGRPGGRLSLAVSRAVTGHSPLSYKLGNGVLHWCAALLLWRAGVTWLQLRAGRGTDQRWAWCVAALWAVHPLQTAAVDYAVQRLEVQAAVWMLLGCLAFLRALETGRRRWRWLVVVAAWAAVATKETAVVLPLLLVILARGVPGGAWRPKNRYYLAVAGSWVLLAALVLVTGGRGGTAGFDSGVSIWRYLCTQAEALVLYVRLLLWPSPLVFDYGTRLAAGLGEVWPQATLVVLALGATVWGWWRDRWWAWAAAWFFVCLAPTSSFVPVASQTIAEHRVYLSLVGPLAGLVAWAARAPRPWAVAGLAVIVAVWGFGSVHRAGDYATDVGLWRTTVEARPENSRARINLGLAWQRAGQAERARAEFERAALADPAQADAFFNLGVLHAQAGRVAAAREAYGQAVAVRPAHAEARNNLGALALAAGDWPGAAREFAAALEARPNYAEARSNLSIAWLELGRIAEAVEAAERAARERPDSAELHFNRGNALAAARRIIAAREAFEQALALDPAHRQARLNLGNVLIEQEDLAAALRAFDEVLRQAPDDVLALRQSGTIFAVQGRVGEALERFERLLKVRPDDARAREAVRRLRTGD